MEPLIRIVFSRTHDFFESKRFGYPADISKRSRGSVVTWLYSGIFVKDNFRCSRLSFFLLIFTGKQQQSREMHSSITRKDECQIPYMIVFP